MTPDESVFYHLVYMVGLGCYTSTDTMGNNPSKIVRWMFTGRRRPFYVGIVFVVILAAALIYLLRDGRNGDATREVKLTIIPDQADVQIKDIHFTEVGDPELTWEIHADTARYRKKENLVSFERVRIKLTRKNGKSLTLTGNEGVLHTDTKDAEIFGNVVASSSGGDVVETDRLYYSDKERKIFTDKKITLRNERMQVDGTGMELSFPEERVTLKSRVKAVIKAGR